MEERASWGESFGTAWGNLTGVNNDGGSIRNIRLLFFLIFIGGTGWAGYNYHKAQILLDEKDYVPSAAPTALEADKKRLKDMVEQVKVATDIRTHSSMMVQVMEDGSRYAFDDPIIFPPDAKQIDPSLIGAMPEPVIEEPPEIVLRAIMVVGKQQVAVMDIAGVGSGMVVKAGDTFMQQKGRVVRIASDKIVVRWAGNNFDIRPRFE